MSILRKMWECESCHQLDTEEPWTCPGCGKETCENCFDAYRCCQDCGKGRTLKQLKALSEKAGWIWDE